MIMCSMVLATASATNVSNEKNDNGVIFESKEKAVTYKVTWNANGGKIGSKKTMVTTVKKGSKIAKLPATPKRSGYTFGGWYNKKDGGKKITINNKPTKSLSYYAQWNKVLNPEEKQLLGRWDDLWSSAISWTFKADGTYTRFYTSPSSSDNDRAYKGFYSAKNGLLTVKYQTSTNYGLGYKVWSDWYTMPYKFKISTENGKQYLTLDDGVLAISLQKQV